MTKLRLRFKFFSFRISHWKFYLPLNHSKIDSEIYIQGGNEGA